MPTVFFIKAWSHDYPGRAIPGVFESLQNGNARIGWSYEDRLDLRILQAGRRTGQALDAEEQDAWRCRRFLEEVMHGDYLIYPHQNGYRQFVIAQVTGDYDYAPMNDSLNGDFRSFRPLSLADSRSNRLV